MPKQVPERYPLTPPYAGQETALVGQLQSILQQQGYAINQLLRAFDAGTFTPTFDIATPGDLAQNYTTQNGVYARIGTLVYVHAHVSCAPTFSTASGALRLGGLPYAPNADVDSAYIFPTRIACTGLTWPGSGTDMVAFMRDGEAWFELSSQASLAVGSNVTHAALVSGSTLTWYVSGLYPAEFEHP